ncbi:hypothetical protein ACH5RR_001014, partial [Cinchona calisaya]
MRVVSMLEVPISGVRPHSSRRRSEFTGLVVVESGKGFNGRVPHFPRRHSHRRRPGARQWVWVHEGDAGDCLPDCLVR